MTCRGRYLPAKRDWPRPLPSLRAPQGRGNLQHHVSHTVAPINIVHPGFSMLISLSAHPTPAVEIATPSARNDMVIGGGSFYFAWAIIGTWSAGAMPPALRVKDDAEKMEKSRERSLTVPRYGLPKLPHLRRNGTRHRPPLSLRARRAWQSASLRPLWGRAARCAAGVTDCHAFGSQ